MRPMHPGRVLRRELKTQKLSANALAIALARRRDGLPTY